MTRGTLNIQSSPAVFIVTANYYIPGTVLSVLHVLTNLILITNELGVTIPILQMWKLVHEEVKELAYRASKWQS